MPPKGGNAKKESGRAKKAENEDKKKEAAGKAKEAKEAKEWEDGSKGLSKRDVVAERAAEQARKKAEREAMLAAEEASLPSKPKSAPKAGSSAAAAAKKKAANAPILPTAGGGIISFTTDDPLGIRRKGADGGEKEPVTELSATGVEGMLEALELINQRTDKEGMGQKAAQIEQHPERRFKAAFEAYLEREMPILREEHPGLRANQMRDKLFKKFEKAPENPFNQTQMAYNASKDEKLDKLKEVTEAREKKYRVE